MKKIYKFRRKKMDLISENTDAVFKFIESKPGNLKFEDKNDVEIIPMNDNFLIICKCSVILLSKDFKLINSHFSEFDIIINFILDDKIIIYDGLGLYIFDNNLSIIEKKYITCGRIYEAELYNNKIFFVERDSHNRYELCVFDIYDGFFSFEININNDSPGREFYLEINDDNLILEESYILYYYSNPYFQIPPK